MPFLCHSSVTKDGHTPGYTEGVKISVELPGALLAGAKRYAAAHRTSLKAVIEMGLRQVLASERSTPRPFRLKRCRSKGKGLAPGLDWPQIRDKIYQGRGA